MTTRRIGAWDVVRRLGAEDPVVARGSESFLVRPRGGADELFELHRVVEPGRPELLLREKLERFAQLRHTALAPVADCFSDQGAVAVVVAHTKGMPLDQLLENLRRDHDQLEDEAVWFVGAEIAGALAVGHAARDGNGELAPFVHGRLSLRHVTVARNGQVRLLALCPGLVVTGTDPASAAWLAPETRRGESPTTHVDAYAVGLLLHSLLVGRPPAVARSPVSVLEARPDVPRDVATLIDEVLDRNRQASRPSCAELAHRFGALVQSDEGQMALQESMDLYRALTGLFSVSAPPVEVSEEPLLLSQKLPEIEPVANLVAELPDDDQEPAATPSASGAAATAEGEAGDGPSSSPDLASTLVSRVEPRSEEAKDEEDDTGDGGASSDDLAPGAEEEAPRDDHGRGHSDDADGAAAEEARGDEGIRDEGDEGAEPPPGRGRLFAAAGVVLGLALWWGLREPAPAPSPEAPASGAPTVAPSRPPPASSSPSALPVPSRSARASASPPVASSAPAAASSDAMVAGPPRYESLDDPLSVGFNQGRLVVRSPVDAGVFVQGLHVGRTNEDNVVSCGMRNLRLGTLPRGERWYTEGKPVLVRCRQRTQITIVPDAEPEPE